MSGARAARRATLPLFGRAVERRFTGSIKFDRYATRRDTSDAQYRDVLPMWVADMDFETPEVISHALQERAANGCHGYTGPDYPVKSALQQYLRRSGSGEVSPEQLVFLPGLVVALNLIANMAARENEAVLTATPIYPPFMSCAHNAGTGSVAVPLAWNHGCQHWGFDWPAMEAAVTQSEQRVGVFLLCNPHNPVGRVFSRDEVKEVVDFCKRHDMVLVSDEIHCELILDQQLRHVPALSLDDPWVHDNTITLNAPSKTFNLAGLSAAFAVIPGSKLRSRFKRESRGVMADIGSFGYAGVRAAYEDRDGECTAWKDRLVAYLNGNVAHLKEGLGELGDLVQFQHRQEATYLCWLDCRALHERVRQDGRGELALWMEEQARLGLNNGNDFGPGRTYDGFMRINLGCQRATVDDALERLEAACKPYLT